MKILLINPPQCGRSIPEELHGIESIRQIFRGEPLALEVLAGNLPGHEVKLLDLKVEPAALPTTLAGFRPDVVAFTAVTCEANLETDTDALRTQRKNTLRKVPLSSLPDGQRPQQLTPVGNPILCVTAL